MKHKKIAKQRNQLVALALFRKAGSHTKSNKAKRRQEKSRNRSSMVEQDAFNVEVQSSNLCGSTI
jgi:hypothetical protein